MPQKLILKAHARFVVLLCVLLVSACSAHAASSSATCAELDKPALVSIQGTFVLNDDEDIRAKTAALFQAIVSFGAMARILLRGFELER